MPNYPQSIDKLINSFAKLPGIGRKTAERFVFFLIKQPKADLTDFADNLRELEAQSFLCPQCFNFSEQAGPCSICANPQRKIEMICVVEEIHDLIVIENTGEYKGLYHVLGGKLDPIEGVTAERLKVRELMQRIKQERIHEVILALNPDIQGEGTIIYLKKLLQPYNVKITLLARGLPMGSDIEYADEATLANALKGRREL